jgi:hypothetical protein
MRTPSFFGSVQHAPGPRWSRVHIWNTRTPRDEDGSPAHQRDLHEAAAASEGARERGTDAFPEPGSTVTRTRTAGHGPVSTIGTRMRPVAVRPSVS